MLSGNKYTSRSSFGSAIDQCLQQIPKEDYIFICFLRLGKKVTKMCFNIYFIYFLFKQCLKRMTQLAINNYSTLWSSN